ncbi:cupredoxin domain-containing protein [Kitasatospora kifunensis]|uniref:cupredoxin domain-containing protein n=1 Tax=Kitasatospora kifunensis TaxID=58351 RepID=UPI0028AF1350|nr:plastocyanin/azurin family copper-binding protein [Kitasatospora kifunensis]
MDMNANSSAPVRRSRTVCLAAVAVVGALGLLSGCGGSSHPKPAGALSPGVGQTLPGFPGASGTSGTVAVSPPSAAPSTPYTSGQPSAPAAANAVTIRNFAFSPAALTVKAGTTVTWTNTDPDAHTVTSKQGSGGPLNSAPLTTGATYSYTFTAPGTYPYFCTIHPFMVATVEVTP